MTQTRFPEDAQDRADGLVEICVDTPQALRAAVDGGADRIELCSALSVGGLTPSVGFMHWAGRQSVAVSAMIRPRAGDFCFSDDDIDIMKREIDAVREAGLSGVVLGATTPEGALDGPVLATLARQAEGLDLTLHRAFDLVRDQAKALEQAIDLGFSRILTSGGKPTALEGCETLAKLIDQAKGRITIMPGSGIRPDTAGPLLERLHIQEIHASCSAPGPEQDEKLVALGFAARRMPQTDADTVRQLKQLLRESRLRRSG